MHIVYCYIDMKDDIIKYVGLTSRALNQRIQEHKKYDEWVGNIHWKICYFYVHNKSESESWESHLIAKYETYNWFNIAKKDWGLISAFKNINPAWKIYSIDDLVVDIDYSKYQIIDNIEGTNLISETDLILDLDITKEFLLILIAKKIIQPLAITQSNTLLFWEDVYEEIKLYLREKS